MKELFVDTSGWANLFIKSEQFHALTKQIYKSAIENKTTIVTSTYVLSELVALLTSPLRISRPQIIEIIVSIKSSPFIETIHIDEDSDEKAWDLLNNRPDKTWSLVDCSSFVLMKQRDIVESLTTDHHFEQAGFIRLLKY